MHDRYADHQEIRDRHAERARPAGALGALGASLATLKDQLRDVRPILLMIYLPVALALAIVVVVRMRTGIAIADFTVDPLIVVGGAPVYTGMLSTIGGLVWSATFAICLFSWFLSRSRSGSSPYRSFLLAAAIITLFLLVDDVFLGHEILYPRYLGIPQEVLYTAYAAAVLGFLIAFRATIMRTNFLLLSLALLGFACSVAVDIAVDVFSAPIPAQFLWEDGAKYAALVTWAAYFIQIGLWNATAVDRPSMLQPSAARGPSRIGRS